MDKNDIIDYVMHTPHNTNRAVLSGMLNQLAEGGGGGGAEPLIVNTSVVESIVTLDKTWQEVYDAFMNGGNIIIHYEEVLPFTTLESNYAVSAVTHDSNGWRVVADRTYTANAESDYPTSTDGGGGNE